MLAIYQCYKNPAHRRNYEALDEILIKLKFFKTCPKSVRLGLYRKAKYIRRPG